MLVRYKLFFINQYKIEKVDSRLIKFKIYGKLLKLFHKNLVS